MNLRLPVSTAEADTTRTHAEYPELIDEDRAALILDKSAKTLAGWRVHRQNLPFHKIGGAVRYRLADVLAFMDGARVEPTGRPR